MNLYVETKQGITGRAWTDILTIDGLPLTGLQNAILNLIITPIIYNKLTEEIKTISGPSVIRNAIIIDAEQASVSYQPIMSDVEIAGDFGLEWKVTREDNRVIKIPEDGYIVMRILPDLEL